MPTSEKGKGPCSLKPRQSPSALTSSGTAFIEQTSESSSVVPVIEKKVSVGNHCGKGVPGSKRQIARVSGKRERVNGTIVMVFSFSTLIIDSIFVGIFICK